MSRSGSGRSPKIKTTPIAIIGMGSIFPQAHHTNEYWDNILRKIDCIIDVPASRWLIEDYYDQDPSKPDKTYCKRGAFIPDVDFDPLEFGLPPNILEVTDVSQLLSLVVARDALEDAGYGEDRQFEREHVGVVLGVVGMSSKIFTPLMTRLSYPVWDRVLKSCGIPESDSQKIVEKMKLAYISWEENAFPGAIGNVIAGRICNRFDLGGMNCVVDAACASSLAALKMAVSELIEGRADMMITGGVDTDNTINSYMCFSKTPAFSKSDHVRTFDAESDGMMVGEGLGMVVLKRLEDAERDGDRVYAVIKAIGTSSDGRFKSIYAPRPAGQAKALRRAYEEAGFSPKTVGLIEAHGTGTMAGDPAEFAGLADVFGEENLEKQYIALGSVKSQIGHTKAAAGAASLMKTALALYHKVLPPTINVTNPNPKFEIENTPFYINTEARPWIRAASSPARRAGVSSFGFGGTNYHVVLEESQSEHTSPYRINTHARGVLLSASDPAALLKECRKQIQALQSEAGPQHFAELVNSCRARIPAVNEARVGFVAENLEEAKQYFQICADWLVEKPGVETWDHPKGIYYRKNGMETKGKVVALFSGQGSQYVEMGRELAINFPTVRQVYGTMDELFLHDGLEPLSDRVYPRPVFTSKRRDQLTETLTRTDHAQPAIGALSASLYKILQAAGFQPDFTAGHSFGELTALWAGGVLSEQDYYTLAKARGKAMAPISDPNFDAGTMLAVKGNVDQVQVIFAKDPEVTLANWNSHNQVVIAGSKVAMARARQILEGQGFQVVPLPVSAAFHTPLVSHAQKPFAEAVDSVKFNQPQVKVFANGTAQQHPDSPDKIRAALKEHILNPVLFRDEILNIHAGGGRIFVEFGPKNILTNLVSNILDGKPHLAISLNSNAKKDSDRQLREAVIALRVAGLPLANFDSFERSLPVKKPRKKSAVTVALNGGFYVSEKTRQAFEDALVDGFKVSIPSPQTTALQVSVEPKQIQNNGNGKTEMSPLPVGNPPAFSTVERLLTEYQTHQAETLHLHEQYLRTEEEYAKAFSQLTQLQTELVSKGSATPGELQAVLPLFESLERSMTRFHEHQAETLRVHQHYLETQEHFSQTFVQGVSQGPVPTAPTTYPVLSNAPIAVPVPERNAYPVSPQVEPLNGKSTTGAYSSPSARTVASIGSKTAPYPLPAPSIPTPVQKVEPVPAAETFATTPAPVVVKPTAISPEELRQALLIIVGEKTGYPVETLEMDMDMEADLGIDSIKRVEILGAMQTQFPGLPKVEATELAELRTLGQIVEKMALDAQALSGGKLTSPEIAVKPIKLTESALAAAPAAPAEPHHPSTAVDASLVGKALLDVVSEKTGYPVETLELDMDLEADLGIDSIKRVEILGAVQAQFPELPKPDATALAELRTLRQIIDYLSAGAEVVALPVESEAFVEPVTAVKMVEPSATHSISSPLSVDAAAVGKVLLEVVSEKTGYPVETLELDMDMEADLGIDSIKRVEILGAVQTQFPELPKPDATALAELRTLRQIIDFLSASPLNSVVEGEQTAVQEPQPPFDPGVEQGVVTRKLLPPPDAIDFKLPKGYSCLISDDGTPVAMELGSCLAENGWPVVLLRFPANVIPRRSDLPAGTAAIDLEDLSEAGLQAGLSEVAQKWGPVAVFIHLALTSSTQDGVGLAFPESEKALVKLVFLAAKHLKASLNEAALKGRAAFMTVTRMDGEFGLGYGTNYAPVNGGLFGLVKTLNLEWDNVYCKALDLSPVYSPEKAVEFILAELYDPNRLVVEVGYNDLSERLTLAINNIPVTGG